MNIEEEDLELDDLQEDLEFDDTPEEVNDEFDLPNEEEDEDSSVEESNEDPLAKVAYEKYVAAGLIDADDNFGGTFEDLEARLEDAPSRALNQAINELPEESRAVLNFISTAKGNITKEEIYNFVKQWSNESEQEIATADEARTFLRTKYKEMGWRDRTIERELDDLEEGEELLTEANKLKGNQSSKSQELIKQKDEDNKKQLEAQKQFYSSINEEIKSLNYTKTKSNQIQNTIPRVNEILATVVRNPKAYVQFVDLLTMFDGKEFKLDKILQQGESNATNKIKEAMSKSAVTSAGSKTKSSTLGKLLKSDRYEFTID